MKAKLVLSFSGGEYPELLRTEFWSPYHPHPIRGLRGSHFIAGAHPFKWGVGVHALSLFFARAALFRFNTSGASQPVLTGLNGSPATSIDYTLWQVRSLWISDLFDVDAGGRNYLQRIVKVLNSRQKKPRPVELYLNQSALKPDDITIVCDSKILSSESELRQFADRLEVYWRPMQRKAVVENDEVIDDGILAAA